MTDPPNAIEPEERLVVIVGEQLPICTRSGAMKSLTSDVKEVEERLFRYAEPNDPHVPLGKRAANEIAASPNVNGS